MAKPTRRDALTAAAALSAFAATKAAAAEDDENKLAAAFDLDVLSKRNSEQDGPWLPFFDNETMYTGVYEIPAGGEDNQQPHRLDELYVVTKGRAVLNAGDEMFPAKSGSIFFVKAEVPHKFTDIEEDLQVIVFFSKADSKR